MCPFCEFGIEVRLQEDTRDLELRKVSDYVCESDDHGFREVRDSSHEFTCNQKLSKFCRSLSLNENEPDLMVSDAAVSLDFSV